MKKQGRPSTYDDKYIEDVYEYLEQCKDEYYDYIKSESNSSQTQSYSREQKIKVNLPTKYGFRKYMNNKYNMRVSGSTMDDWANAHPLFRGALNEVHAEQKQRLLENGVSGAYNSTIGKLILSANHGMAEKKEVDQNVTQTSYHNFLDNLQE